MKNTLNKPYVKTYNQDGTVSNPIVGQYLTQGDNRRERRRKETPFISNGKNYPLTVSGNLKYRRFIQSVYDKAGNLLKKINHYLPQ